MKRLISVTLTAFLTMGLIANVVMADPEPEPTPPTSEASIEFDVDDSDEGLVDPEDPPDFDDDDDWVGPETGLLPNEPTTGFPGCEPTKNLENGKFAKGHNLEFGEVDAEQFNMTYASEKRIGIAVNAYEDEDWTLTVEVGKFLIDEGTPDELETIKGFILTLKHTGAKCRGSSLTEPITTDSLINLEAGLADVVATGGKGLVGANYRGYLSVFGGTADKGKAIAVLDWTWSYNTP